MPSAVTDAYSDAATYRAVVGKSDTAEDDAILVDLKAVSRYLDRKLGRFFTKDAAAVARIYVVPGDANHSLMLGWSSAAGDGRMLFVDDMAAAPTSVKVDTDGDGLFTDEDALAITNYELWPLSAAYGPEPEPYTALTIPAWSTATLWPAGRRVQVTAQWGWPAVPEAIARATCHLAAILRLESPRATTRVSELGERLGTSKAAQTIVDELAAVYGKSRIVFA